MFESPIKTEISTAKPRDPYLRLLKYIVAAIVFVILIGGAFVGWFYSPYIRANIAISLARGKVTPLYEQVVAMTPPSAQITHKSDVQSGMYAFSLSDSADQYAHVWARLDLNSPDSPNEVIDAFAKAWSSSGLLQITEKPAALDSLFRSPVDGNLLAGVCRPTGSVGSPKTSDYVAFIDYADGPRCDNPSGTFACLVARYCTK